MSLTKDQILQFEQIDKKIKELYLQQETLIKKILKGAKRKDGHIKSGKDDFPFLAVTITDNTKIFETETIVSRVAYFKKYDARIRYLKRKPSSKD